MDEPSSQVVAMAQVRIPKVTIEYCTQCRWLLRAAYYAQELLSTFGTAIGEISLRPATGGTFNVTIEHIPESTTTGLAGQGTRSGIQTTLLWDRKVEQGFPETKELKRRLRDIIEPGRDLGHVDRHGPKKSPSDVVDQVPVSQSLPQESGGEGTLIKPAATPTANKQIQAGDICEDCDQSTGAKSQST